MVKRDERRVRLAAGTECEGRRLGKQQEVSVAQLDRCEPLRFEQARAVQHQAERGIAVAGLADTPVAGAGDDLRQHRFRTQQGHQLVHRAGVGDSHMATLTEDPMSHSEDDLL